MKMSGGLRASADVLRSCLTYLFDCDGVIWKSNTLLPSSCSLIQHLIKSKRNVYLITNNSRKSLEEYAVKCKELGLPITEHNIICTANVAAQFIRAHNPKSKVYVIGEQGLALELEKAGLSFSGIGPDEPANPPKPLEILDMESDIDTVLVGFDPHFNYRKLLKASTYIHNGACFYATNEDAQLPDGKFMIPGTGSIVAAVKTASGKEPFVFGKPNQCIYDVVSKCQNFDPAKTIMIGDNLYTDIAFGNKFNLHTACVLTGVTTTELINKVSTNPNDKIYKPSLVFQSTAEILEILQSCEKF